MLVITVSIMGVASTLVGFLPTRTMIGWWAVLPLVSLRIIRGTAAGCEWEGAALLAVESSPAGKRAFYGSGVQVGCGVELR